MKKAIISTAIISLITKLVYFVIGIFAIICAGLLMNSGFTSSGGIAIALVRFAITEAISIIIFIIYVALLINSAKSDNDNIVCEMILLIIACIGMSGILTPISNLLISYLANNYLVMDVLSGYYTASSGTSYVSFIDSISCSLMIVSTSLAFAKKKWINGLVVLVNGEIDI